MTPKADLVALVGAECEENLALRYIRSSLESAGFDVVQIAFDSAADTETAAMELADSRAALAGFSMVFTYRATEFAVLAARARALGYDGHIVAGGHFAAFNAEDLLRDAPAFDSVAAGEGERIMVDLASSLDDLSAVNGLVWRDERRGTVRNAPAAPILDLDALPPPVRRTPPDCYLDLPIANMLSSRGCTHACHFCSIAAWRRLCGGPRFRARSPASVAAEMGALYRRGYRLFNFHDDNFILDDPGSNMDRILALREALRGQGVGPIGFAIKARPDRVDEETFGILRAMGLFRVFLGVEAGTEASLAALGRRQSLSDNVNALAILNGLDLHVCFNILLFNPDSTIGDVLGNIAFMERHPRNPMNFCRAEVYAGTPLEARLRSQNRLAGSFWGHGYRISDPCAQRAFELTHALLFDRHHGEQNLHHLTMRVDYERQLLSDFFRCSGDLGGRARAYVARVNTATAALLRRVTDLAATGANGARQSELRAASEADTEQRLREGYDILDAIRREATTRGEGTRLRIPATGLAASLALTTGAAVMGQTHVCEMVAPPARTTPAAEPKNDGATNQAPRAARPPDGDFASVRNAAAAVFTALEPYIAKLQNVDVEFWIGDDGLIAYVAVYKEGMAAKAATARLTDEDTAAARKLLADLGNEKFAVREKATKDLKAMGAKVVELVRAYGNESADPEVQERCKAILLEGDCFVELTDKAAMEAAVRTIKPSVPEDQRGKRFVGPFDQRQMQRMRSIRERRRMPQHIFEMAPAARD